jgi:hypothetical protein
MAGSTLTMIVVTSGCDGNHFSLGRQNAHEPWKIAQKAWFQSLRGHAASPKLLKARLLDATN